MAETLVGGVELKRISDLLAKTLLVSDLSDYNVAIDKAGEADTKRVALDELLAFASGGVNRIYTTPPEIPDASIGVDNNSIYCRLNTSISKLISTFRVYMFASTTTNLVTVKLYNANGTEIVGAEGAGNPTVLTTLQNLDISLATPATLTGGVFYWVGIHQATGGGASLYSSDSVNNTDWNRHDIAASLQSSVPAGVGIGARPIVELM